MSNLFSFIAAHPTVPQILSFYAQLAFNFFILVFIAFILWSIYSAFRADVDEMAHNAAGDIYAAIAECSKKYDDNRCALVDARPPALHGQCEEWARCMSRDPMKVGRARLSARTFAEIFNNFVEPISYKAMAFSAILIFGCFAVCILRTPSDDDCYLYTDPNQISNFAFSLVRNKAQQYQPQYQPPPYNFASPPPPTPQRSFSGPDGQAYYPGTPWNNQHYPNLEPQPSQGYGQIEGQGSPVRRIEYH